MNKPEYFLHEEFQNRSKKLNELKELGIDPFPHRFDPKSNSEELHTKFNGKEIGDSEAAAKGETTHTVVAGRLVLFRSMGKNAFATLQDDSGRIQVMLNKDLTELEGYTQNPDDQNSTSAYKIIEKKLDLGDIIGVEGHLFHTHKGELTIYAKKIKILCKTLLPLAEKHSGLHDKETRYRKRWLDLISNKEVQETFKTRSKILHLIRQYCFDNEFIEVETPILQSIYGGAEARPFTTKLNALNQDMFMRISPEISLKKLIIGGINRVFEIAKCFRNEGIDRTHNPEFTMIEAYAAYWDYNDMMKFVENLYEKIALELFGTTKFNFSKDENEAPVEIDVKAPWIRLPMKEAVFKYAQINVDELSDDEMKKLLLESEHVAPEKIKNLSRGLLIAAIFEVFAEPKLIQPHHIIDHPVETTVLCKPHRNSKEKSEGLIERFESFILGGEICNAYTELNDPIFQRELLEGQQKRKDAGDEEAAPLDEEFLEAICQGLPPTGGVGIGIDRLVMLFTNSSSIRDVLFFPWMKPLT